MEVCKQINEPNYDANRIPAPDSGTFYYQDSLVPYLRLKVSPVSRSWVFDKSFEGKHVKRKIGRIDTIGLPEARMRACEWAKNLAEGVLPSTVKQRHLKNVVARMTLAEVFNQYFDNYAVHNCRTAEEMKFGSLKYWKQIASLPVIDLTPQVVQAWFNALATNSGKATANKQYNTLRACVNWAISQQVINLPFNPFRSVRSFKIENQIKYLKQDESTRLLDAIESQTVHPDLRDAIKLLLFTGQRKSNVLEMEFREIDFDNALWRIPPSKTKSNKEYAIPLSDEVIQLLRERQLTQPGNRVFSRVTIDRAWQKLRATIGLEHINIHAFRHTHATNLAKAGATAPVLQKCLGHSNISTSLRYIHLETADLRAPLAKAHAALRGATA